MALPAKIFFTMSSAVYPGNLLGTGDGFVVASQTNLPVLHPFRWIFPGLVVMLSRGFMATCTAKVGMVG